MPHFAWKEVRFRSFRTEQEYLFRRKQDAEVVQKIGLGFDTKRSPPHAMVKKYPKPKPGLGFG